MSKSPTEQFLEVTDSDGGNLTEESVAKIESLLIDSRSEGTEDWTVAAHFLVGLYYRRLLSGLNYGRPDDCELKVIEHFRAFLEKANRPCESLTVNGEELDLPDLTDELWAAFAYSSNDWGEVSRVTNDLSSVALDGVALAYYQSGDPLNAANALEDVITHAPGDELWRFDDSRLVGWIGWLYFDAAVYDKAAEYMQLCWDRMPQYIDRESSSETTNEFIAFAEWYIYYGSQPNNSDIHAFTDMGDGEDFLPSGSLGRGCDAFLLQLAISHAANGLYEQAFKAADLCVKFGEPLQDLHLDLYEDFQPIRFPEAHLIRAALSLKLSQGRSPLVDLDYCYREAERFHDESLVLTCLYLMQDDSQSASVPITFAGLKKHLTHISTDQRSQLATMGETVLAEILDGSLVKVGFRSATANQISSSLRSWAEEADQNE